MFLKAFSILIVIILTQSQEYQLQFDWKLNTLSTDIDVCTVTWNGITLSTLKQLQHPDKLHHSTIPLEWKEGLNQLNFFYVGINGRILIDNVMIIKPPKTINYIVNGDFQMESLKDKEFFIFSKRIPGWSSSKMKIMRNVKLDLKEEPSQALFLNPSFNEINQKISFGKIRKYSFSSTFSQDLKKKANQIIAQNIEKYSHLFPQKQSNTFSYDPSQQLGQNKNSSQHLSNKASQNTQESDFISDKVQETLNNIKSQSFSTELDPIIFPKHNLGPTQFVDLDFNSQDLNIPGSLKKIL